MGWETSQGPKMFIVGGEIFRKPQELANILQKFYKQKVEKLLVGLEKGGRDPLNLLNLAMERWEESHNISTFTLKEVTGLETLDFIRKLGNSTAMGQEGLDAMTLKVAAGHLVTPLTHIINVSIRTSQFANKWKVSRIIPILKSKESSRSDPSSYRPVALLPVTSKLVERAIQTQLQKHMEKEHLLNRNNHAYRRNLSTSSAIMQLVDSLYEATDRNLISQLMALDQSSAFDCVCPKILIRKLEKYGCSPGVRRWMESYMSFRTQYTNVGRHDSEMVAVHRGVPQGSIVGPLLYIIYTNEISEAIKDENCSEEAHEDRTRLFGNNCDQCGTIITYADDLTYHIASEHRERNQIKMDRNLKRLQQFLNDNDLVINIGKTAILECMIKQKKGRNKGEPPQLVVQLPAGNDSTAIPPHPPGQKVIREGKELRILGVNIQQNMGWQSHLEKGRKAVLPAARKQFGALQQLGRMMPESSRKLLAEGLIMSKLSYVITQWGGATDNYILTVQRLQNKVMRWITRSGRRTKIKNLLEETGWMSIQEQIRMQSLTQMWKILRLSRPEIYTGRMNITDENYIITKVTRLQFTEHSYLYRTSKDWNLLPDELRETMTLPTFKRNLRKWTMEKRNAEPD